jgi:hypothetical protein
MCELPIQLKGTSMQLKANVRDVHGEKTHVSLLLAEHVLHLHLTSGWAQQKAMLTITSPLANGGGVCTHDMGSGWARAAGKA